jgi:gas vesicle protein
MRNSDSGRKHKYLNTAERNKKEIKSHKINILIGIGLSIGGDIALGLGSPILGGILLGIGIFAVAANILFAWRKIEKQGKHDPQKATSNTHKSKKRNANQIKNYIKGAERKNHQTYGGQVNKKLVEAIKIGKEVQPDEITLLADKHLSFADLKNHENQVMKPNNSTL